MKAISRIAQVTAGVVLMLLVGISSSFAYSLKLTSSPSRAKIFINGVQLKNRTPVIVTQLTKGKKYQIFMKKNGFEEYQTIFKSQEDFKGLHADLSSKDKSVKEGWRTALDENNATSVQRAFGYDKMFKKGTYGWLYVGSVPNKATVFINDKRQSGVTPNNFKTPIGVVKVSVVVPGKAKQDYSRVLIKAGETTNLGVIDLRDPMNRPTTGMLMDNE